MHLDHQPRAEQSFPQDRLGNLPLRRIFDAMENRRLPVPRVKFNLPAPVSMVASRIDTDALNLEMWTFWMGYHMSWPSPSRAKFRAPEPPHVASTNPRVKPKFSLRAQTPKSPLPPNQPTNLYKQTTNKQPRI